MLYEITVTLRPQMYRLNPTEQLNATRRMLVDIFRRDDPKAPYKVSLVAELTGENNIHFHGIVDLRDFKHRHCLINHFRPYHKTLGKKSITQLVDYPKWVSYINKDIAQSRQLIGDPIVFDDLNVLCDAQYRFNPDSVEMAHSCASEKKTDESKHEYPHIDLSIE